MRIIAGSHRGKKLKSPKGLATRPVLARVREALFTILGDMSGLRVLDLFAGTGAIGLEALSRGADSLVLVESGFHQCSIIRDNLAALGREGTVIRADVSRALKRLVRDGKTFDFIFLDPPYERGFAQVAVKEIFAERLLSPGGIIAATVRHTESMPDGEGVYEMIFDRRYGDTRLVIYREKQTESGSPPLTDIKGGLLL